MFGVPGDFNLRFLVCSSAVLGFIYSSNFDYGPLEVLKSSLVMSWMQRMLLMGMPESGRRYPLKAVWGCLLQREE